MARINFLIRVLSAYLESQDKNCPYCGSEDTWIIGRKRIVLQLRKCSNCSLMFRWPKDTIKFNRTFYQKAYKQNGLTTDLPDLALLDRLEKTKFTGSEKDFSEKIVILRAFVPEGKVLDFGCSWGYATFQLQQSGYDAVGFEISKPRAEFGRSHLGIKIIDEYSLLDKLPSSSFDVIFSSHVLEHLRTLKGVFERFSALLRPGGVLLLFVPNCGGEKARKLGVNWGPMVCEKHPLALDQAFFKAVLPKYGFAVQTFSNPYDLEEIRMCTLHDQIPCDPRGDELMVCARKTNE